MSYPNRQGDKEKEVWAPDIAENKKIAENGGCTSDANITLYLFPKIKLKINRSMFDKYTIYQLINPVQPAHEFQLTWAKYSCRFTFKK